MSVVSVLFSQESCRRVRAMAALNVFGFVYFIVLTSLVTYLSMFHVVPMRFGKSEATVLKHFAAILYLLLNVLGNFINVIRIDSKVDNLNRFRKIRDKEFHLECSKCKRGVPRRVHHCPLCDTCILKRDHHCFFMCTCIGYFNQKYFIMFCFYMTIAGLYGSILLAIYMHIMYKVRFTGMITFVTLLPSTLHEWWFSTQNPPTFYQLSTVGIFYACLTSCLMASGLLLWQVYLTAQGLTTHEARCGITKFSRSMKENFLDVFGPYWFVTFVLPIPLPQKSDGAYIHKASSIGANTSTKINGRSSKRKGKSEKKSDEKVVKVE